jgi:hypothetical protein
MSLGFLFTIQRLQHGHFAKLKKVCKIWVDRCTLIMVYVNPYWDFASPWATCFIVPILKCYLIQCPRGILFPFPIYAVFRKRIRKYIGCACKIGKMKLESCYLQGPIWNVRYSSRMRLALCARDDKLEPSRLITWNLSGVGQWQPPSCVWARATVLCSSHCPRNLNFFLFDHIISIARTDIIAIHLNLGR